MQLSVWEAFDTQASTFTLPHGCRSGLMDLDYVASALLPARSASSRGPQLRTHITLLDCQDMLDSFSSRGFFSF